MTTIDQTTITFGVTGDEKSLSYCSADYRTGIPVPDLVCKFDTVAAGSWGADVPLILRAIDTNQMRLEGRGSLGFPPGMIW